MTVAAGLTLWLARGTTFNVDQIRFVLETPDRQAVDMLVPQNGHLVATTRALYKGILEGFGAGYLPFRIVHVVALVVATALLYLLIKRRIGAAPALAAALVLLFFGSDWPHVGTALGFTVLTSLAAGLGALLSLERGDARGDAMACALVLVSVATFSVGLAFLVGVAVSVMLQPRWHARAWVFAIPLVLYVAWWLWAPSDGSSTPQSVELSSLFDAPDWIFRSLSAVSVSLVGLSYNFSQQPIREIALGPGPVLAALMIVAVAWRLARGRVPPTLWAALAMVLSYWILASLAEASYRFPAKPQYMFPGAVLVLVVVSAAASRWRARRTALIALIAVTTLGIAGNAALLYNGAASNRDTSSIARAQFAALDLARGNVAPDYNPHTALPGVAPLSTAAYKYYP